MDQAFSWIVTILGLVGFWLAGKKVWWCWYVNIANQLAWVIFALITDYYAFLLGTAFYFVVFSRNAWLWTTEHFETKNKVLATSIDKLVTDYDNRYKSDQPEQTPHWDYDPVEVEECGNVSSEHHIVCIEAIGHGGMHQCAGKYWTDAKGVQPLK